MAKYAKREWHGYSNTKLWDVWSNIIQRCCNKKSTAWKWYGGKGVKVCDEWRRFMAFREWALGNGYADGMTIDRKDSSGSYNPGNCRWITQEENTRRASAVYYITAFGERKTPGQWASDRRCRVGESCLRMRVARGMDGKRAITTPSKIPRGIKTQHDREAVVRLYRDNRSIKTLAVLFKAGHETIRKILFAAGINIRKSG